MAVAALLFPLGTCCASNVRPPADGACCRLTYACCRQAHHVSAPLLAALLTPRTSGGAVPAAQAAGGQGTGGPAGQSAQGGSLNTRPAGRGSAEAGGPGAAAASRLGGTGRSVTAAQAGAKCTTSLASISCRDADLVQQQLCLPFHNCRTCAILGRHCKCTRLQCAHAHNRCG